MGKKRRGYKDDFQLPLGARLSGAQLALLLAKGDTEGHPFRGNQWTSGEGSKEDASPKVSDKGAATYDSWKKDGYDEKNLTAYAKLADEVKAREGLSGKLLAATTQLVRSLTITGTDPSKISGKNKNLLRNFVNAFMTQLGEEV